MARSYVADLAGGTATVTVQIQASQTLKRFLCSVTNAAAGKVDLSTSPASEIGTTQPTSNVQARINVSGTAGPSQTQEVAINLPVKPFQSIYLHQTGAGNLGSVTLS